MEQVVDLLRKSDQMLIYVAQIQLGIVGVTVMSKGL